ncbi:MAG: DUF1566 domain-containing protein [bacterium]
MYEKNHDRSETQYLPARLFPCKLRIKKAFSLAEMMVVMLILSLVIAASMPIITKQRHAGSSALAGLETDLATLTTAVTDLTTRLDALDACPSTMVKVVDLCVAKTDASAAANWATASTLCWDQYLRLPSIEELNMMYVYRNTIGGFSSAYYWSATVEYYNLYISTWVQHFSTGEQYYTLKSDTYRVRCVRSF